MIIKTFPTMTAQKLLVTGSLLLALSASALASENSREKTLGKKTYEDLARQSHIEANVPASGQFASLLARDLRSYFQTARVDYELLRQEPTQNGASYPKYYLWVKARNASGDLSSEGAVRVAAIDQVRFEVTYFSPAQEIRAKPTVLEQIFPSPIIESILSHVKTTQRSRDQTHHSTGPARKAAQAGEFKR